MWAKSNDRFVRHCFTCRTHGVDISGLAITPKGCQRAPVIFYLHGSGGSALDSGSTLRQFAEVGLTAVDFDYTKSANAEAFALELTSVWDLIQRQEWANTNHFAWIGSSLGAQNLLIHWLSTNSPKPDLFVRMSGGIVDEIKAGALAQHGECRIKTQVLLVHGTSDSVFSIHEAELVAMFLQSNGVPVDLKSLPSLPHSFGDDRRVVIRAIAEWCKAKLTPEQPLPEFPRLRPYRPWICILPALAWVVGWNWGRVTKRQISATTNVNFWNAPIHDSSTAIADEKLTKWELGLRIVAVAIAFWVVVLIALHLITPKLEISPRTVNIARKHLIRPEWTEDFDTLATRPIWRGQQLNALLTNIELAHYTVSELVNWKVDTNTRTYRDYVLSPVIDEPPKPEAHSSQPRATNSTPAELTWRRDLWENFWPRVRHENSAETAAQSVARFLRERVTIAPNFPKQAGVESIWRSQIANLDDFDLVYVAALRSVGVPARLADNHHAEFCSGTEWHEAPRPLITTWTE